MHLSVCELFLYIRLSMFFHQFMYIYQFLCIFQSLCVYYPIRLFFSSVQVHLLAGCVHFPNSLCAFSIRLFIRLSTSIRLFIYSNQYEYVIQSDFLRCFSFRCVHFPYFLLVCVHFLVRLCALSHQIAISRTFVLMFCILLVLCLAAYPFL